MSWKSLCAAVAVALGQAACVTPATTPKTPAMTHVVTRDATYYTTGPQQARPPDGTLKRGTKARVLGEGGSYVQIETETGLRAWVGLDEVAPLASKP